MGQLISLANQPRKAVSRRDRASGQLLLFVGVFRERYEQGDELTALRAGGAKPPGTEAARLRASRRLAKPGAPGQPAAPERRPA